MPGMFETKKTNRLPALKINYRIITLYLLLLMTSFQVHSETSEKILFLTEELRPFQYYEDGKLTGINVHKIRSAITLAGITNTSIDVYPWARSYQTVLNNKNAFIFSMVRTKERENKFIWVCQLDSQQYGFYGRPLLAAEISSVEDAKNFKTVVLIDDLAHKLLLNKGFKENHNLIVLSNLDSAFKMVLADKAELIVANKLVFNSMAREFGYDEKQWRFIVDIPELQVGHYLATNTNTDTKLIDKIRKAMRHVNKENAGCQH